MGRARRQSGGGRTSGDSNEISLDGMLSASNESRRVSKFSGYRSVFPISQGLRQNWNLMLGEWQGWNIPVFDLRSGLGLRSSGFASGFFSFFFFFGRPGSRPMRSNRNLTFDRQRRRNINGTNWPVYYILCLMLFFPFFFLFVSCKIRRRKIYKRQISILYNSWKRLPFRLD